MKLNLTFITCLFTAFTTFAQIPKIKYSGLTMYTANTAVTPLVPVNTGGVAKAGTYQVVSTLAGDIHAFGADSYGTKDGTGAAARFYDPRGIAVDASGNVYIADTYNYLIRMITPTGVVTTVAGSGIKGVKDGKARLASFSYPSAIGVDRFGDLYVTDNNLIRKIIRSSADSVLTITPPGRTITNITGRYATLGQSFGIAVSQEPLEYDAGLLNGIIKTVQVKFFVPQTNSNVIDQLYSGYFIYKNDYDLMNYAPHIGSLTIPPLAGTGIAGSADGNGPSATFDKPFGIALDKNGNLYVSDTTNNLIRKIDASGLVTTIAGSGKAGFANGYGKQASFHSPRGLAVDSAGNVYVADYYNNMIRKIDPAGLVTTFAGNGVYQETDGFGAVTAEINHPSGIAIDGLGNFYVSTAYVIRKIKPLTTTGYTINPTLPPGLVFDVNTGTISGSPTVPIKPAVYTITAYNESGPGITTVTIGVDLPIPTITADGPTAFFTGKNVMLTSTSSAAYSYQWLKDGSEVAGATESTFSATQSGSYNVTISQAGFSQVSAPTLVDVEYNLPPNNFSITNSSATCRGASNGALHIRAVQPLNYTATITVNGSSTKYTFTDSVLVNNLVAGAYNVCFTVAGQPGYQQCFTSVITEPKDLSVYSYVQQGNQLVLELDGSGSYNIKLNGTSITTTDNHITLALKKGVNALTVTGDRACQGEITKQINLAGDVLVYPNPFNNTTNLNLGTDLVNKAVVNIYNKEGRVVFNAQFTNQYGVVPLDLNLLSPGVYILKLSADNRESFSKIIKK